MSEEGKNPRAEEPASDVPLKTKRPYKKPAFQCERTFETMALACGKVSSTQAICRFNRKRS
jgi:hypothetical protein